MPVYLKLPWIGNISRKFEKQVKSNVQNCLEPSILVSFSNQKDSAFNL